MNITSTTPSSSTSSLPHSKLKYFHIDNIEGLDTHMLDEYLQHFTGLKKLTIGDCNEVDLEGVQWEPLSFGVSHWGKAFVNFNNNDEIGQHGSSLFLEEFLFKYDNCRR
ncbi:hypothetical protein PVK06_041271 [Gossypium arboreum]|uniref:Leucine-rich repeat domain, L domain-containing protein n=1 Tax=Gossypium arboreum TaxID=29729 RepID=A0ABR0N7R8_GOSAR|nr:hypothetical protein PVK06_041271 [Gossypium arboreum]